MLDPTVVNVFDVEKCWAILVLDILTCTDFSVDGDLG